MPQDDLPDTAHMLVRWRGGDPEAIREVVCLAYSELHRLAGRYLHAERTGHTLQPTALVHEVYLRLVGERMPEITSRGHFLAIASRLMRQILVNHAVARKTLKRGDGWKRVPLDDAVDAIEGRDVDLESLDLALRELSERDPLHARVVEMRFFGGLTIEETAEAAGVSPRKVVQCWTFARAWLFREMRP